MRVIHVLTPSVVTIARLDYWRFGGNSYRLDTGEQPTRPLNASASGYDGISPQMVMRRICRL